MAAEDDKEGSTLFGRAKRYSTVATGLAGVALRSAGRLAGGMGPLDPRNAHDMAAMLGSLRGPLMKVAQVAGSLPDVFPPEFAAELANLQNSAPSMGQNFVRRRMAAELGSDWEKRFKTFDLTAAHAASLGQVHRAVAIDGRNLACKLQYPDMKSAVEADMTQFRTALSLQRVAERKLDTSEIAREVEERILEELDYTRERKHMRLFRIMLADRPAIAVPDPVENLSTARLLTMTWLDGVTFQTALQKANLPREKIAEALFLAWGQPLFRFGVVHGDAHFGNYSIHDDGLNLLDFGCVRIFEPRVIDGLIDLYRAVQRDDAKLAARGYEKWGFRDVSGDLVSKMDAWARLVFTPLLKDRPQTIGEGSLLQGGAPQLSALWDLKVRLREGGALRPPREFVFIARAIVGLASALVQLDARVNWHRMFEVLIDHFDLAALAARQADACRQAGLI